MKLLPALLRALLLWLKLSNHQRYYAILAVTESRIAELEKAHAAARLAGDSTGAARLFFDLTTARQSAVHLSAGYLALGGGDAGDNPEGNLHAGDGRGVVPGAGGAGAGG